MAITSCESILVLLGRQLMAYVGVISPPDIYTSAIGLYILWATTKAITAIVFKMKDGMKVVSLHLLLWVYQVYMFWYIFKLA